MAGPVVLLDKSHRRKDFDCGVPALDRYFKQHAAQDMRRHLAVCFVLSAQDGWVQGYYTLSNTSIAKDQLPEEFRRRIGYHDIPVTLLGRLAVDIRWRGQRMGEFLLMDALFRSLQIADSEIASLAVVTDPIDDVAAAFYRRYGFIALEGTRRLFLPMATVRQLQR